MLAESFPILGTHHLDYKNTTTNHNEVVQTIKTTTNHNDEVVREGYVAVHWVVSTMTRDFGRGGHVSSSLSGVGGDLGRKVAGGQGQRLWKKRSSQPDPGSQGNN